MIIFFTHFVHPTFPPLVLTERDGSMRQKTGHPAAGISPHGAETELINVPPRYNDGALFERFGFSKNAFYFFLTFFTHFCLAGKRLLSSLKHPISDAFYGLLLF